MEKDYLYNKRITEIKIRRLKFMTTTLVNIVASPRPVPADVFVTRYILSAGSTSTEEDYLRARCQEIVYQQRRSAGVER